MFFLLFLISAVCSDLIFKPENAGEGYPFCYVLELSTNNWWKVGKNKNIYLNDAEYKCFEEECGSGHYSMSMCSQPWTGENVPTLDHRDAYNDPEMAPFPGTGKEEAICIACFEDKRPYCSDIEEHALDSHQWCSLSEWGRE